VVDFIKGLAEVTYKKIFCLFQTFSDFPNVCLAVVWLNAVSFLFFSATEYSNRLESPVRPEVAYKVWFDVIVIVFSIRLYRTNLGRPIADETT